MNVVFSNLDDFLADLKAESEADGVRIDDGIVRVQLARSKPNQTQTEYALSAGFSSLGELRIFETHCGTDFAGVTPEEGSETSTEMLDRIEKFCAAHDLSLRGGRFETE